MIKNHVYDVLYKDNLAFTITSGGKVIINNYNILPMDIYVEESNDIDDLSNNIVNFDIWCSERIVPLDRRYAKELLGYYGYDNSPSLKERANIGITTRCLSLNDCFWVKEHDDTLSWKDVNLFENSLNNTLFELPLLGKGFTINRDSLTTPDIGTDGKAPKAWKRDNDTFYLYKAEGHDNAALREYEASKMLQFIINDNIISYSYNNIKEKPVTICKCFTNQNINMVKAEYYSIYLMNQDSDFGIDLQTKFKKGLDLLILSDYLVGNIDRHGRNWGVLYNFNGKKFNITNLSPIYDFDHAFESTGEDFCQPYHFIGRHTTLENAAKEIIVNYPEIIQRMNRLNWQEYFFGEFVKQRIEILNNHIKEQHINVLNKTQIEEDLSIDKYDGIEPGDD